MHELKVLFFVCLLALVALPAVSFAIEGSSSSYTFHSGIISEAGSSVSASSSSYTATVSSPPQSSSSASSSSYTAEVGFVAPSATTSSSSTTSTSGSGGIFSLPLQPQGTPTRITFKPWGENIEVGDRDIAARFLAGNTILHEGSCTAELDFVFSQPKEDIDSNALYKCGQKWCARLSYSEFEPQLKSHYYHVKDVVSSGSYTVTCSLAGHQSSSFTDEFTIKTIAPPLSQDVLDDTNTTDGIPPVKKPPQQIVSEHITLAPLTGKTGTTFEVTLLEGSTKLRRAYFSIKAPGGKLSHYEMSLDGSRTWKGAFTVDDSFALGEYEVKIFGVLTETVLEFDTRKITIEPTFVQIVFSLAPPAIGAILLIGVLAFLAFLFFLKKPKKVT